MPADITNVAKLEAAIDVVRERFGPITVLLNNAANDQRHKIEATTSESWDAGIAVNLKHQFFAAKKVSTDMKAAGGGSIINFGSVSWKLKQGGMPVYTTAKSAVQGLTRSLARDFGPFNIRVNTIVPGWVMTEKQKRLWLDEAGKADIARGQCINQPLMPIHIASMTLFLAADDSAMCTRARLHRRWRMGLTRAARFVPWRPSRGQSRVTTNRSAPQQTQGSFSITTSEETP